MKSKHEHPAPEPPAPPCEHAELRWCKPCDAVECRACGKEWKDAKALALAESFRDIWNEKNRPPYTAPASPYPWRRFGLDFGGGTGVIPLTSGVMTVYDGRHYQ